MTYLIYGKHTKPWRGSQDHLLHEPDKMFRAINYQGVRVTKLEDAASFATKEDAQEFLDKHTDPNRDDVAFEIRKAK